MDFKYSFHPVVELQPGESCSWQHHFDKVCGHVIWYLDAQAERRPIERFVWVHIDTIVAGINKQIVKLGHKPYHKRAVEYALAHIEDLEIIARIGRKRVGAAWHHGFLVAPHRQSCHLIDETHCKFSFSLKLKSFRFDRPGVKAGEFIFHGPKCACEFCKRRYNT